MPEKIDPLYINSVERFGIGFAFDRKNLGGDIFDRIVVIEVHGLLKNYRSVIVYFIGKMYGAAAHHAASFLYRPVDDIPIITTSTENRNERGVNVHHIFLERFRWCVQFQVAGEADDINIKIFQYFVGGSAVLGHEIRISIILCFFKTENAFHVENIDIGGPTLLRASAKNFEDVTVVVDPSDYETIIEEIRSTGTTTLKTRFELARKVFALTSSYDTAISKWLNKVEVATNDYFKGV